MLIRYNRTFCDNKIDYRALENWAEEMSKKQDNNL